MSATQTLPEIITHEFRKPSFLIKICQDPECRGPEYKHDYQPPNYNSSDGLPTFAGCFCKGILNDDEQDDDFFSPIPVCTCLEFVDPEAVEPEDDTDLAADLQTYATDEARMEALFRRYGQR